MHQRNVRRTMSIVNTNVKYYMREIYSSRMRRTTAVLGVYFLFILLSFCFTRRVMSSRKENDNNFCSRCFSQ